MLLYSFRLGITFLCILQVMAGICELREFARGKWSYDPTITKKSHVCCGWDTTDWKDVEIQQECGPYDIPNKDKFQYGRLDYNVQCGGHACVCDEIQKQRHVVSEREKWRWRPESGCKIMQWNATQFCELLGDKRILMIGDSTMMQSAATVMNMLLADRPAGKCGPQLMIYHFNKPDENPQLMMAYFQSFAPDIAIFNFGAHFHNDGIFMRDMKIFVDFLLPFLQTLPKPVQLIWKTINSPHFACDQYKMATEEFPKEPHFQDYYQWELFPIYDNFSLSFFPRYGFEVSNCMAYRGRWLVGCSCFSRWLVGRCGTCTC